MIFSVKKKFKNLSRPNWSNATRRSNNKLWLDKNENINSDLTKLFKKILNSFNYKFISSYPELGELYSKIAKLERLKIDNIFFSNGSDGCIKSVFDSFTKRDDKVLTFHPTFAMYDIYPTIKFLRHIKINYLKKNEKIYLNLNNIISSIKKNKPKLICFANPNSPTGTILSDKEILKIIKISKKNKSNVLIDEAYFGFSSFTAKKYIKRYNNVLIVRTFSKYWGLAGLRLGYVLSSKKNIDLLNKMRPMYEINNFGAEFLLNLLNKKNMQTIQKINKSLFKGKNLLINYFKKNNIEYLESHANFLHLKIRKNRNKILKDISKIAYIRKSESFNCLKGYTRISLSKLSNMRKIVEVFKKYEKI